MSTPCSTEWLISRTVCGAAPGKGTPETHRQCDQHRDRWLRPWAGDGLRGIASITANGVDISLRFERGRNRLSSRPSAIWIPRSRCSSSLPRPSRRSRRWPMPTRPATGLLAAVGGDENADRQALRGRLNQRRPGVEVRHRYRRKCSSSGTGSADAIPWTSAIGLSTMLAIGPEHFSGHAAGLPRDGRTFSHGTV